MKILIPTAKEMNEIRARWGASQLTAEKQNHNRRKKGNSQLWVPVHTKSNRQITEINTKRIRNLSKEWKRRLIQPCTYLTGSCIAISSESIGTQEEKSKTKGYLLLTSSSYGVASPLVRIAPHRLDLRLHGQTLKNFWRTITGQKQADEDMLPLLSSDGGCFLVPVRREDVASNF